MKPRHQASDPVIIRRGKTWIYMSDHEDEDAELEFELDFQASLTVAQRYRRMFKASKLLRDMVIKSEHRETAACAQRE